MDRVAEYQEILADRQSNNYHDSLMAALNVAAREGWHLVNTFIDGGLVVCIVKRQVSQQAARPIPPMTKTKIPESAHRTLLRLEPDEYI